jgi:hypothetical protein
MIRIVALVAAFTLSVAIAIAQTTYKRDLPVNLAKQPKVDEQTAAAAARPMCQQAPSRASNWNASMER